MGIITIQATAITMPITKRIGMRISLEMAMSILIPIITEISVTIKNDICNCNNTSNDNIIYNGKSIGIDNGNYNTNTNYNHNGCVFAIIMKIKLLIQFTLSLASTI